MPKPVQTPRAFVDLVDYLHGLGFDHLYLTGPSSRSTSSGAESRPGRSAAAAAKGVIPPSPPSPGTLRRAEPRTPGRAERPTDGRAAEGSPSEAGVPADRSGVVFGAGKVGAGLMFLGEEPGTEGNRQGLPFAGPTGALLTRIIDAIDWRREDVYMSNIVSRRTAGKRTPDLEEIAGWRPYLEAEIDFVKPQVLVILGRAAAQSLLQTQLPLGRLRDDWHTVCGVPTRVTYHPSALLRYEKYKRPTWEDMKAVRERLHRLRR
ncbi:MAG: uracil-DNA glycosylase family protein [Acidobacteriota bacterium]